MTVRAPVPPDLNRLPRSVLQRLIADAARLPPVPADPLPMLDSWMLGVGEHGLLRAEGHLEGAAERISLPVLAVSRERSAAWLVGAAWVELGAHALAHQDEDGEDRELLFVAAKGWCDAIQTKLKEVK